MLCIACHIKITCYIEIKYLNMTYDCEENGTFEMYQS